MDQLDQDAIIQYMADTFTGLDILRPTDGPGAGDTFICYDPQHDREPSHSLPFATIVVEANRGRPISAKVASLMQDDCGSVIFIFTADEQLFADGTRACAGACSIGSGVSARILSSSPTIGVSQQGLDGLEGLQSRIKDAHP